MSDISVPGVKKKRALYHNGHWKFPKKMGNGVGFIYVIRDNALKRFYLGKKLYISNSGKKLNWKYYKSSSTLLHDMFEARGENEFDFIVLDEYKTRSGLSYAETWSLCFVDSPLSNTWFNTRIERITWNVTEPVTDTHKRRLHRSIALENSLEEY
ncbi:MAG: hypothetical protein OEX12_00280 [Gammaproteobacteria bacterium]|nr:hypothetical protein [Gammaproteobacteria bacterium]